MTKKTDTTDTMYKWLHPDRTTTYRDVKWPKRIGAWTPDETPNLCVSGWHLATHQGIGKHAATGAVLWVAEGRGARKDQDDKVAFTSARLVREIGTLTQEIAVTWAVACARRTLKHYEAKYPDDKRPREALLAAGRWAKSPTEVNRQAAYSYSCSATAAYAAHAAINAATAAAHAAPAADAYAGVDAKSAERYWQSDRLLALLRQNREGGQ